MVKTLSFIFFVDGGTVANKITNYLVFMICKDNRYYTLNTTEKHEFKFFMKTVEPLYTLPGRKSITKIVDDKYDVLFDTLKMKLSGVNTLTLTTDIWTDTLNTKSYLRVTCHYLHEMKLKSINLKIMALNKSHTSDYIGQCLTQVLEE